MIYPSFEAQGQTVDTNRFQAFIASDVHKTLISRTLSAVSPEVFRRCPALVSPGSKVIPMSQSISFGQDGVPNSGAWIERFPVVGCGNDTILNFYFSVGDDGKIKTDIGLPGGTHAGLLLQHDALFYAYLGASSRVKDCKQFLVKNTRFEGYGLRSPPTPDPGANDPLRPWWETWTIVACGRVFDVLMDFAPHSTGTTILQPQKEIIER
jgi:hypothetical protein